MKTYTYKETKEELKNLASEIKSLKSTRKTVPYGDLGYGIIRMKLNYRIKHIAMSMFRGKTLEQIEPTAKYDYPSKEYIKKEAESYLDNLVYDKEIENVEETLCDCA